jgi:DNA-binding MarR family transcriptional regulator
MSDSRDRRRTLVWLTDQGLELLAENQRVLSVPLLHSAMARMPKSDRRGLLEGLHALVRGVDEHHHRNEET